MRIRWYPTETITDADYGNNLVPLANVSAQAESLLHSLEQAAGGIGLLVNANKTEFGSWYQDGDISLNGEPLKLVNKFIYLGNKISSTESNVNIYIVKA